MSFIESMTTPILEIATAEAIEDRSPVQKLIALVLLVAIKDRASEVCFQARKDKCRIRYVVKGVSLELVPAPAHIATNVIRAIQAAAELDLPPLRSEIRNQIQLCIGEDSVSILVQISRNEQGKEAVLHISDPGELSSVARTFLNTWRKNYRINPSSSGV
jgi:type IV pilus assembly protein PilB